MCSVIHIISRQDMWSMHMEFVKMHGLGNDFIFPCHIFIKFPDLLRLGSEEIIMLQKLLDLDQKITVYQIDLIMFFLRLCPKIPNVFLQYPEKSISGIQIIV